MESNNDLNDAVDDKKRLPLPRLCYKNVLCRCSYKNVPGVRTIAVKDVDNDDDGNGNENHRVEVRCRHRFLYTFFLYFAAFILFLWRTIMAAALIK